MILLSGLALFVFERADVNEQFLFEVQQEQTGAGALNRMEDVLADLGP